MEEGREAHSRELVAVSLRVSPRGVGSGRHVASCAEDLIDRKKRVHNSSDARARAGEPRERQVLGLATALRRADLPQQCSDRSSADPADRDHAVIDLYAAIAATHRGTEGCATESDIFQCCLGARAEGGVKLGASKSARRTSIQVVGSGESPTHRLSPSPT